MPVDRKQRQNYLLKKLLKQAQFQQAMESPEDECYCNFPERIPNAVAVKALFLAIVVDFWFLMPLGDYILMRQIPEYLGRSAELSDVLILSCLGFLYKYEQLEHGSTAASGVISSHAQYAGSKVIIITSMAPAAASG